MCRGSSANPATVLVLLLLLVGVGCQETPPPEEEADMSTEMTASESMNMLTDAERAEGWELLFDGEHLDAWRGFQQDSVPAGWVVGDGTIYFTGKTAEGEGGDLFTKEQYGDFELSLEWKISEGGNSGIIYRSTEDHDASWMTGPEYQVLDDAEHPDADVGANRRSGANYDMHAPTADVVNPAGEWNQTRIVANGAHVEHWLNGEKIVEYELWSDAWEERVANSKWNEHADYGMNESGHIALQDHGNPVWFRNVKIKRLSDAEAPS